MRGILRVVLSVGVLACGDKESLDTGATDTTVEDTATAQVEDTSTTEETDTENPSEPSGEDTSIVDTSDTADASDTSDVQIYGCQADALGVCLEGFVVEGWTYETASASCTEFATENSTETHLLSDGCPMTPETVVGACVTQDIFTNITITEWFYTTHWTEVSAEDHCTQQNGLFVT